jgi:hypothetical protein
MSVNRTCNVVALLNAPDFIGVEWDGNKNPAP